MQQCSRRISESSRRATGFLKCEFQSSLKPLAAQLEQVSGEASRALDIPKSQPSLSEAFGELLCAVGWAGACRQSV